MWWPSADVRRRAFRYGLGAGLLIIALWIALWILMFLISFGPKTADGPAHKLLEEDRPVGIYYARVQQSHESPFAFGSRRWISKSKQTANPALDSFFPSMETTRLDLSYLAPSNLAVGGVSAVPLGWGIGGRLYEVRDVPSVPTVIVFIHGFSVGFEEALRQARVIAEESPFVHAMVAFVWPSLGRFDGYEADELTIRDVHTPLKELIDSLARSNPERQIVLVAHSIGNRALLAYLQERLKLQKTRPQCSSVQGPWAPAPGPSTLHPCVPSVAAVVMIAPDIDAADFAMAFRSNDGALGKSVGTVFLLASPGDMALYASAKLHGGATRAGQGGSNVRHLPNSRWTFTTTTGGTRITDWPFQRSFAI